MAEDNVALTKRAYAALEYRDFDAFVALMAEDVEIHSRIAPMEGGYRGHDGSRRWWDAILDVFPDLTIVPIEFEPAGDSVLVRLRTRGHAATSEVPFDDLVWQVIRWREGKCVWWRVFYDEAEAREAAGAQLGA